MRGSIAEGRVMKPKYEEGHFLKKLVIRGVPLVVGFGFVLVSVVFCVALRVLRLVEAARGDFTGDNSFFGDSSAVLSFLAVPLSPSLSSGGRSRFTLGTGIGALSSLHWLSCVALGSSAS